MKTINYSKNIALVAVATMGVVLFGTGAQADESSPGAASRAVSYSDLHLESALGAQVLYQRIRVAAQQVCGDVGSRQLEEAAAAKACVSQAIVSSVRAVNSVQLTRIAKTQGYPVQTAFNVASVR